MTVASPGNRPHVFHLITRLQRGGAEAKTIQTVLGLESYAFTLGFGASYDRSQRTRLERAGVPTRRFRTLRHYNPATAIPAVLAVAAHLRRNDYDLVHTHSTEAGIVGRFAARLAGDIGVVHTVHGVPFTSDRHRALNAFVLRCERVAARYTDRIVANADAISADYLDRGIGRPDQYETVYSGIDLAAFRGASPATDLPGDGLQLVTVGRLVRGKGLFDLLDAVARLEAPPHSVAIVGDGPLRDDLAFAIRERGLSDVVSLLGYREDVPAILAASDVFVLPSYREGTPRVVTEAMASGLPVVATDIAGVPEQVRDGENGYLVEPGDVAALSERLERLLAEPRTRQAFGERSRELVERFSRERMLADLADVYESVLAERAGASTDA